MPHKHIELSRTGFQGRPHDNHDHLVIQRLNETRPADKTHYMMNWMVDIHAGEPLTGHFFGPTVVYIVEGEFNVEEQSKPGQITHLVVGDVIHIDEDSFVTWTSPVRGRAFGVAYVTTDKHPEDIPVKK